MEFEFAKNVKKQGKFQLIESLYIYRSYFCSIFIVETWM